MPALTSPQDAPRVVLLVFNTLPGIGLDGTGLRGPRPELMLRHPDGSRLNIWWNDLGPEPGWAYRLHESAARDDETGTETWDTDGWLVDEEDLAVQLCDLACLPFPWSWECERLRAAAGQPGAPTLAQVVSAAGPDPTGEALMACARWLAGQREARERGKPAL